MQMNLERLHVTIAAVCPIESVCVEDWDDKDRWVVDFSPSASPDEKAAAREVVANYSLVEPVPVPAAISDRQFFQQLAIEGTITQAQALAAVKVGTIPPVLQGFVDSIADPAQRFAANMLLAGATVFERAHPMTEAIRVAQGRTHEQTDDFFRAASAL